jgi:hypothetical protein
MNNNYYPTVRYWLEVEALTYPDLPKHRVRQPVKTFKYEEALPWESRSEKSLVDDHKYFVYFGLIDRTVLERELRLQYGAPHADDSPDASQVRPDKGRTFLGAIEVTAAGQVAAATLQLAAFALAFAEKKHGRRFRLGEVTGAVSDLAHNLRSGDNEQRPVNGAWFAALTDFVTAELAWSPSELMAREQICVQRVPIVDKNCKPLRQPPELPPINSFYVDDLNRIVTLAERGQCSDQVAHFLDGDLDARARVDVTELEAIDASLRPERFPVGRWPSTFPLFAMQQVAVNGGLGALADGGVFSVNGPPGTGKTTLLMDVVAARIVERARILASFTTPELAFRKDPPAIVYPSAGDKAPLTGSSFSIDPRLLDFGIVVASSNNNAVENITRDLPNVRKIDAMYAVHDDRPFDYFAATANALFAQVPTQPADNPGLVGDAGEGDFPDANEEALQCWGLISVPLGKKSNRNRAAYELGAQGRNGIAKALRDADGAELDWAAARAAFFGALGEVETLQAEIAAFDATLAALNDLRDQLARATVLEHARAEDSAMASSAAQDAAARDAALNERFAENMAERALLAKERGWLQLLLGAVFRTRGHMAFTARRQHLGEEYDALREARTDARRARATLDQDAKRMRLAYETAQAAVAALSRQQQARTAECAGLRQRLGEAAFDPVAFAALPTARQQKSLPRSNAGLHAARARVFIAAMHLHKAFMKHAGKGFETNFRLALAMLGQQSFLEPQLPTIAPHLWASLFLAVPVVSSTFASFSRCFKDLGEGQIGLLLIDEAGQAVPAHALGAIWRSKRAMVVGDPLQVEPVIKMEPKLDLAILTHHHARESHQLTRYSAQHLADRANRLGAHVVQYDGSDLWVGSPLRVHRRCVDPMFGVANRIAYNDKMVFGPDPEEEVRESAARPLLGPSAWVHVDADDFVEHYSAAEGMAALDMIRRYQQQGWVADADRLPDLFVISPFKSVAEGVGELLRECQSAWAGRANDDAVADWLKARVGTVHTFQGKECESVVFVLGGRSPGARQWAAARPNIINVAVTRAKRRIYVVGNRKAWQATAFGARLADALPALTRAGAAAASAN